MPPFRPRKDQVVKAAATDFTDRQRPGRRVAKLAHLLDVRGHGKRLSERRDPSAIPAAYFDSAMLSEGMYRKRL
jgi:hypothetical protein